jgi:hypothetical protein
MAAMRTMRVYPSRDKWTLRTRRNGVLPVRDRSPSRRVSARASSRPDQRVAAHSSGNTAPNSPERMMTPALAQTTLRHRRPDAARLQRGVPPQPRRPPVPEAPRRLAARNAPCCRDTDDQRRRSAPARSRVGQCGHGQVMPAQFLRQRRDGCGIRDQQSQRSNGDPVAYSWTQRSNQNATVDSYKSAVVDPVRKPNATTTTPRRRNA